MSSPSSRRSILCPVGDQGIQIDTRGCSSLPATEGQQLAGQLGRTLSCSSDFSAAREIV